MRRLLRDIAAGKNRPATRTTLEDFSVLAKLRGDEDNLPLLQLARKLLFLIQVSRPIIWPILPLVYCLD